MQDVVEGRWAEVFGPKYLPATVILCLGVALFAFNAFLSSTSLPTAVRELEGVEVISWATTLYLVFAIMGGAGAVLIKERLGSRWALLSMAVVFLAGTLLAATAGTMTQVLIGRAIQGLGEGVIAALCFALIPELFPTRLVPKLFGTQAMVWAVAGFGGPALAGALTEFISWRAAFLVNVPLVAIFIAMVVMVVPTQSRVEARSGFPGIRLLAVGGGIILVAVAAVIPAPQAALALVAAALLLVLAIWLDRRSAAPLTPRGAFGLRTALGPGFWLVLLMPVAGAVSTVYLVLLLQQLWDYGPTLAGVVGAVMAMAWSASSITVANAKRRSTRKVLIRTGPLLLTLGLIAVLFALQGGQIWLLLLGQIAIGMGFGCCNSYIMLTLIEVSPGEDRDRTSALIPTTQSAGNAIGAALAGVVANAAGYAVAMTNQAVLASIVPLFVVGAAIALLAAVASFRMVALMPATAPGGMPVAA